jgi:hypothetical protein
LFVGADIEGNVFPATIRFATTSRSPALPIGDRLQNTWH